MSVSIFDLIVLFITAICSLLGMGSGFIRLLINLLSFIVSIYIAIFIYPYLHDFLTHYVKNEIILVIAAGSLSYILPLLVVGFCSLKITGLLSGVSKGFSDRILGLFFGFLKGLFISSAIFILTVIFVSGSYLKSDNLKEIFEDFVSNKEKRPAWLKKSISVPYLTIFSEAFISLVPEKKLEEIKLPKEVPDQKKIENILQSNPKEKKPESSVDQPNLSEELKEFLK